MNGALTAKKTLNVLKKKKSVRWKMHLAAVGAVAVVAAVVVVVAAVVAVTRKMAEKVVNNFNHFFASN